MTTQKIVVQNEIRTSCRKQAALLLGADDLAEDELGAHQGVTMAMIPATTRRSSNDLTK